MLDAYVSQFPRTASEQLFKLAIKMGLIVKADSLPDLADREIAAGESRANA
jgi:hypothetical protein